MGCLRPILEHLELNAEGKPGFDADACAIGAGPSGPATARGLVDREMGFDWFEKRSMVGGLLRIDNNSIADRLPNAITDRLMRASG